MATAAARPPGLIFKLIDYIELFDQTGRVTREDKRDPKHAATQPILQRLDISKDHWLELSISFESRSKELYSVTVLATLVLATLWRSKKLYSVTVLATL